MTSPPVPLNEERDWRSTDVVGGVQTREYAGIPVKEREHASRGQHWRLYSGRPLQEKGRMHPREDWRDPDE